MFSSLIDFLEPAKTRGWVLFLDPCNLSTEEVQWTTGLILWLWECPGILAKTSKVSAPKLRASAGETKPLIPWSLEIAEALLDKLSTFENTIFHDWMQHAVQRPLEPTRISYSRAKIPATLCLPLWERSWRDVLEIEAQAPPLPCEFDECCPSQNWTSEDMGEPCLPLIVFFFFSPLIDFN